MSPTRLRGLRLAATLLCLSCLSLPAMNAAAADTPRTMTPEDLVMFERVSDPRLSPDGTQVVYQVRETDYEANKGINSLWLRALAGGTPRRLTASGSSATSPRWSPDGKAIYFLSSRGGSAQVWRLPLDGGEAQAVTALPLDVGSFVLSPDGRTLIVSMEVFPDCDTPACTKARLEKRELPKSTGELHDKLFVRHWDTWANGTRSQLFALKLEDGRAHGEPLWLTKGIDGDVPSKPFGDDAEYSLSPDSQTLYFTARIAGTSEPWSTNFDLFRVPLAGGTPENLTPDNPAWDTDPRVSPDGRWLAWRAMKRPGFEADRFGILLRDLQTGATHELAPSWDRSADGLQWSQDGKRLYTMADELGQKKLFALDAKTGKVDTLTGDGTVGGFDVRGKQFVYVHDTLAAPAQLYALVEGGKPRALTQLNSPRLAGMAMGSYEQFSFKGWNDETVYGYVVKPADYVAGRKYPVAFIIHGGPQGSMGNHWHYRWNPQTYAAAGFAAVFIDFHGSTGYGQGFTDAISGHWGDRPLEDLQKGWAHALAKYDFLDATRATALGASYGGYMINWIAGNWSAPWKALVNHDGVFDNRMMAYSTEELWFDEWENQGTPWEKPQNYERFNPVNHVADWKVPMLVIHGGQDFRIPMEQGLGAFTVLQRRGIPSQLLYFPDENHWVLKPQNSVQWQRTVLAWLKRWAG